MTTLDTTQLRRATPWFCWSVSSGEFFASMVDAKLAKPADAGKLLVQYRFDDDGTLAGRAKPVWPT